jgi:3-deoxy-D-manno-octulosonic-acid transferase
MPLSPPEFRAEKRPTNRSFRPVYGDGPREKYGATEVVFLVHPTQSPSRRRQPNDAAHLQSVVPGWALVLPPGYLLKMRRRGNYRRNFGQRFGIYSQPVRTRLAGRSLTWIHAVSVGEVAIALKLARSLRALDPAFHGVLTTTTTTGFAVAEKEAGEWLEVMYNPLDFWPVVRRAFALIQPARIVLVEAEVWPNLAAEACSRKIPIVLVNARLSERSERRFRRFGVCRADFRGLDLVCVRSGRRRAMGRSRRATESTKACGQH